LCRQAIGKSWDLNRSRLDPLETAGSRLVGESHRRKHTHAERLNAEVVVTGTVRAAVLVTETVLATETVTETVIATGTVLVTVIGHIKSNSDRVTETAIERTIERLGTRD